MKVTLDLDRLLREQRITHEEHRRLLSLSQADTRSLGLHFLIAFGVVATAGGVIGWLHSILAAVGIGFVVGLAGVLLLRTRSREWNVPGTILTLVGALTAGAGIVKFSAGDIVGFVFVMLTFGTGAYFATSGLLASLTILAFAGVVGAATAYEHACYILTVQRPTLTVTLFGLLSWGFYRWSLRLNSPLGRLALMMSRTSLFLVNLGFWVGSLWGDTIWHPRVNWEFHSGRDIPDWAFGLTWAIGILATGVWALRRNRRWVVNLMAVFASIHFYTQYFERLGAKPGTLVIAGVLALAVALLIARYNRQAPETPSREIQSAA